MKEQISLENYEWFGKGHVEGYGRTLTWKGSIAVKHRFLVAMRCIQLVYSDKVSLALK